MTEALATTRARAQDWLSADRDKFCVVLAVLVFLGGVLAGLMQASAGPWMDEFNAIATTLPQHTLGDFLEYARRGQHPLLFEGLLFAAQKFGVTDIVALRLVGFLGVPLVGFALWIGLRRGTLTVAQGAVILALYGSSSNLFYYIVSLRPYFLVFSASIAVALAFRLMRREDGKPLWLWAGALAIFVNTHYFATILGGMLTIALLWDSVRAGQWRKAAPIAAASFVAALPALAVGVMQASYTTGGGVLYYYPAGLGQAFSAIHSALVAAMAANIPAALFAAIAFLAVRKSNDQPAEVKDALRLLGVTAIFLAAMIGLHLLKPMLFDRYLIAAAGPVLVAISLLAAGVKAPRAAPLIVCAFAVIALPASYFLAPRLTGWTATAETIQHAVAACPQTHVYAVPYARVSNGPIWTTPLNPTEVEARSFGYRYYAQRYGFTVTDLHPGDTVQPQGPCPTVIWIEHFWPEQHLSNQMLYNLNLRVSRVVSYEQIGSGVVLTVSAAP